MISAFYCMMMYFNDGGFTAGEIVGLGRCALVILGISALLWAVYRLTRRKVFAILGVK